MAIADIGGIVEYPLSIHNGVATAAAFEVSLLDAVNEYCGCVVQVAKSGNISKLHFMTGTVTTGATLNVTLESVNLTNGQPGGALTNGSTTVVVANADDNVRKEATFSPACAVTRGDLIAIKIANPGASAGNLNINRSLTTNSLPPLFPRIFTAVPTYASANRMPVFALEYDDGSFAYTPWVWPFTTTTLSAASTLSTGTTPDEAGNKIVLPFKATIKGFWFWGTLSNGSTQDFVLYDTDGSTALATYTTDEDNTGNNSGRNYYLFSSDVTVDPGTYRIILKPTNGISCQMFYFDVHSAEAMDGFNGGQDIVWTQRTDAGSWTETTTRRAWIGLLISGLDDGVSVGGGGGGQRIIGG